MTCACTQRDDGIELCGAHRHAVENAARDVIENRTRNLKEELAEIKAERDKALIALGRSVLVQR